MKDIERIQSTELAVQVQDANPANFAIEQEVAQLVGATVPSPTEPSADDARELGAQLLVFLRRALLPIRSALRTALAAIYAHLDSRCTAYTPAAYAPYSAARRAYDPMGNLPPRSVANLLTAITAFAARKISNGSATADGIPDGTSLAHILGDSSVQVTKIVDDNTGWTWNRVMNNTLFPYLEELHVGCRTNTTFVMEQNTVIRKIVFTDMVENNYAPFRITSYDGGFPNLTEVSFPKLKIGGSLIYWSLSGWWNNGMLGLTTLNLPELETIKSGVAIGNAFISGTMPSLKVLNMPKLKTLNSYLWGGNTLSGLEELHMPNLTHCNSAFTNTTYPGSPANLIDVEVGAVQTNMDIRYWNPTNVLADADKTATFLQNFKEHIALRLTANGSGLTLTLSQAVFSAVIEEDGDPVLDPIRRDIKGIIVEKGWQVKDTNNIIFPT